MITCNILGPGEMNNGLGNQMFCVATTLALAWDNDDVAVFPDLNFPPFDFYGKTMFHKLKKEPLKENFVKLHYKEKDYSSTIFENISYENNLCINGHFQSYKYFQNYEEELKEVFSLPKHILNSVRDRYKNILALKNPVSIHVRRGDYISDSKLYKRFTILSEDYYSKALELAGDYDSVIIFSDDIEWCKNNLNYIEVEKFFIENEADIIDLYLMSQIKKNIIANSSFSWWSAFLNPHKDKKVIAPWNWFGPRRAENNKVETKDLIPESWERI